MIQIRRAVKEDCPRLLELITELAVYEKAPNEVTVTLEHFIESGFGKDPVWWAFVATPPLRQERVGVRHSWICALLYSLFNLERATNVSRRYNCYRRSKRKRNREIINGSFDRRSKRKKIQSYDVAGIGME